MRWHRERLRDSRKPQPSSLILREENRYERHTHDGSSGRKHRSTIGNAAEVVESPEMPLSICEILSGRLQTALAKEIRSRAVSVRVVGSDSVSAVGLARRIALHFDLRCKIGGKKPVGARGRAWQTM